jgi:hypothetical protein
MHRLIHLPHVARHRLARLIHRLAHPLAHSLDGGAAADVYAGRCARCFAQHPANFHRHRELGVARKVW